MISSIKQHINFYAFLWHAIFLASARTLTNTNTILPAILVKSGGSNFQIGILTGIMVGTPLIGQLLFASYLHLKERKKPFLLLGINLRVFALTSVAIMLSNADNYSGATIIFFIFILMFVFSMSGTFAGVSYSDILGKSLFVYERERFFIWRQVLNSFSILISAFLAREILSSVSYPANYQRLFLFAAALLFVATLGFWAIKEKKVKSGYKDLGFSRVVKSLPRRLRTNKNLRNYIYMLNFSGFGLTLLPFYLVLAKENYGLTGKQVGTYLLLHIIGMILSNFIWARVIKKHGFRGVFKCCIIIWTILPILAITLVHFSIYMYLIVFFLSGFSISAMNISSEGIFIEITTDENRALHKGMVGATSLSIAIFPIIAGWLIGHLGFAFIFLLSSVMAGTSYYFANNLEIPPAGSN